MSQDRETLDFYDSAAVDYADRFSLDKPDRDLLTFMAELPPGGHVLDFGCGPGRSSAHLVGEGFSVTAWDASQGMLDVARDRFGIVGRRARFDELNAVAEFDGIFANFSLLHAPREDMPANLARMHRALKPGGRLHLALKLGEGEKRDHLGRYYCYWREDTLRRLLSQAGFAVTRTRTGKEAGLAGVVEPFIVIGAHA